MDQSVLGRLSSSFYTEVKPKRFQLGRFCGARANMDTFTSVITT